jgi:hypothetical protein
LRAFAVGLVLALASSAGLVAPEAQAGAEPLDAAEAVSAGGGNEPAAKRAVGGFTPPDSEFLYGNSVTQNVTNCSSGGSEAGMTSFVAYTPSRAKVGQRWWGRVEMYGRGFPCGSDFVRPTIQLPDGTGFAINNEFPFRCEFRSPTTGGGYGPWRDITNETRTLTTGGTYTACVSNGTSSGHELRHDFAFRVSFPVVSTEELRGAAASPPDVLQAGINTALARPSPAQVFQFVTVSPPPQPEISYPSPSTDQITSNGAHSRGFIYNYNRAGTMFVEIGKTTDYGTIGESYPATRDAVGYQIDQDWQDLRPSTTYHWRLRFVDSRGNTTRGADQTFVTAGAPPSNVTKPTISGTARKGQRLTAKTGQWEGTMPITFSYQWQRCDSNGACVPITGATARTYRLGSADVGNRLRIDVEASNSRGQSSASSAVTGRIKR